MSDEVKATVTWRNLKLDTYTNLRTGEIKVYRPGFAPLGGIGGVLLATSKPENGKTTWVYNDQDQFRRSFNIAQRNKNKPELSQQEFNRAFFTTGTQTLNTNVRAKILLDEDNRNYENAGISVIETEQLRQTHFDNRIPGVIDPVSRRKVNNDGTVTATSPIEQQPVVVVEPTNGDATPDPDAPPPPALPGEDTPDNVGTNLDGDGVISQGDNPSYNSVVTNRGGTAKTLRYPYHTPPAGFEYDYISITAYDYKPSGLEDNYNSDKNLGQQYETIFFPMQPQLSETNAVSWSDDQLNPIQAGFGDAAKKIIDKLGGADISGAFSEIGAGFDKLKTKLNDSNLKSFISAYFAGQAVGANIVGRATGMVINPNLELLFNGPNLRTFSFNFRLTPRSQVESEEIRRIIRAFKRNMAVSRSSSNLFLTSPRIFKLKYIYKGGGDHPYLNKFKPCALSNFAVNYTPDGSYATFDSTGSLTAYDLTMTFSEIMPIYADDIPDNTEVTMGY
jgi:hypothetical protein